MAVPYRFQSITGTGLAIARRQALSNGGTAAGQEEDGKVAFTHLSFTFPLKLISPRTASRDAVARIRRKQGGDSHIADAQLKPVAALYVIGYGGGLVSGDKVTLDVDVGEGCSMVLLTQGSTKVYKMRKASHIDGVTMTTKTCQSFRCIVRPKSTLIVLPDPVTCFAGSRYVQTQQFDLRDASTSSLVLLDWFTPGRVFLQGRDGKAASSERWAFTSYTSRNEVRVAGQEILARDVLVLEQSEAEAEQALIDGERGPIARKCEPYTCFATLLLYGPDCVDVVKQLKLAFHAIQQHHTRTAVQRANSHASTGYQELLWSCSPLTSAGEGDQADTGGLVVRVAGLTTESVRRWLREHLTHLTNVVGDDLYRQALGT